MNERMKMRREAREYALQFLFEIEYEHSDIQESFKDFWTLQERPASPECVAFTEQLIWGVLEHMDSLDATLKKVADNWEVKRMSKVDRNILRIALFEMKFRPDIPPVVSINEAVDIARDFSGSVSGKFVNGILDRISKGLDRPLRTADGAEGAAEADKKVTPESAT